MLIGIDPGKSGGVAWFDCETREPMAAKMPATEKEIWLLLAGLDELDETPIVFLEKIGPTPQMGVTSSFTFGRGVGGLHMACIAAGLRIEYVTPQKWQRALGLPRGGKLGSSSTDKKNAHKRLAEQLYPTLKITHAIADALLILEYGRQVYRGAK